MSFFVPKSSDNIGMAFFGTIKEELNTSIIENTIDAMYLAM